MDVYFSIFKDHKSGNNREGNKLNFLPEDIFFEVMAQFPEFTNLTETIYAEPDFVRYYTNCKENDLADFLNGLKYCYLLDYNPKKELIPTVKNYLKYSYINGVYSNYAELKNGENYRDLKLMYDISVAYGRNLITEDKLITESYLTKLRIKEETDAIKLNNDQKYVIRAIDGQCRWFYIPTDNVSQVLNILGIQPDIKESNITSIIDDVQRVKTIAIATFTGHTIIFGCNVPYIAYPDLQTYLAKEDHHTTHLQDVLNKLSKAFGIAAYFEYNNDDEQIASLAWSSKGKFVYGRFTSEGEGHDIFGTQKKTMDVNQKSIIKTAKKLGMTPEDILTGIMKQKLNVQYFEQPNWYIESRLILR